jgi:hypothetical protein
MLPLDPEPLDSPCFVVFVMVLSGSFSSSHVRGKMFAQRIVVFTTILGSTYSVKARSGFSMAATIRPPPESPPVIPL